jgi:predicted permease
LSFAPFFLFGEKCRRHFSRTTPLGRWQNFCLAETACGNFGAWFLPAALVLFGGKSAVYGSVAAAVGVAYLIYYLVEGRRTPPGDGGPPRI